VIWRYMWPVSLALWIASALLVTYTMLPHDPAGADDVYRKRESVKCACRSVP
jgi:hypothetical protein